MGRMRGMNLDQCAREMLTPRRGSVPDSWRPNRTRRLSLSLAGRGYSTRHRYNSRFMDKGLRTHTCLFPCLFAVLVIAGCVPRASANVSWNGQVGDSVGNPVAGAIVQLRSASGQTYAAATTTSGKFALTGIPAGSYELSVKTSDRQWMAEAPFVVKGEHGLAFSLQLATSGQVVLAQNAPEKELTTGGPSGQAASGGEHLSSSEVSSLPLNARDFSKLLLLAAGTMTDANGAANFTQQFAVNGQRGTTTVFALDGFDTTDPEMGGATFSNFNVDAIQEVQANS